MQNTEVSEQFTNCNSVKNKYYHNENTKFYKQNSININRHSSEKHFLRKFIRINDFKQINVSTYYD